jgi:hypothetical protein
MKKSPTVTLTIVTAMGLAAKAQPAADPCTTVTFNAGACKTAIHAGGYCSGGAWLPVTYSNPYPYYYDLYRSHLNGGGSISPAVVEKCHRPLGALIGAHGVSHGGFGATGRGHHGAGA